MKSKHSTLFLCLLRLFAVFSAVKGFCSNQNEMFSNLQRKDTNKLFLQRNMPFQGSSRESDVDISSYVSATSSFSFVMKREITKHRRFFRKHKRRDLVEELVFDYDYDVLNFSAPSGERRNTTGVILIHPIGVGIGRWFYDRLSKSFYSISKKCESMSSENLLLITPDLIGSGTALGNSSTANKLPLLNISDWSDQLMDLMKGIEELNSHHVDQWCLVANGGCSPIALQVAARSLEGSASFERPVSNVILSSLPRLSFFLQSSDPLKVSKSYKTLSGIIGKLFWWYSCRNEGQFIQKFSEKNLVAKPESLGDRWRVNCYETAQRKRGKSKYSTFAFLAGTLQDGCASSLKILKMHSDAIQIDVIKGRDVRQNRAKSWFWQRQKHFKKAIPKELPRKSFRDYLEEYGLGGREILIDGRISLAHEDATGYRDALLSFLKKDDNVAS